MARLLLFFIFIHFFFVRISGPYLMIWQEIWFCLQMMYSSKLVVNGVGHLSS